MNELFRHKIILGILVISYCVNCPKNYSSFETHLEVTNRVAILNPVYTHSCDCLNVNPS